MPDLSFSKKIRLLIVDDSFFFRTVLKNGLDADPRIEVVGMAADAEEAFKKIRELNPDVVTMDVEMPKLNGIDFIKRLIPVHPVPVVVVSSLPLRVLDALEAGAVDFVRKPAGDTPSETKTFLDELRIKVKIASTARVRQKPAAQQQQQPAVVQPHSLASLAGKSLPGDLVIAIGASTGGTDIIAMILKKYTSADIGSALFLADFFIAAAAFPAFGATTGLFSLLGLGTKSLTVNFVMENMNLSKSFTIITDNPDPICRFIVEDLNRSASTYRAEGIYTHQDHTVIMTTMGRQQGSRLQRVIREADPHAFVVITNTSQVIGKGFRGGN